MQLSRLASSLGHCAEPNRLLSQALKIERELGRDHHVAQLLYGLSNTSRWLGSHKEGIQQVKESLEIFKRLGDTAAQASFLV